MKRKIVVAVEGEVDALLKAWAPPAEVEVERQEAGLTMVFTDENLAEFHTLEAIVDRLKPEHTIEVISFFQVYDFSKEDLRASELLWLQILTSPGLEVEGQRPIEEHRCGTCGRMQFEIEQLDRLQMRSRIRPKGYLLAAGTLNLFHRDLIEKFERSGMDRSLQVVPCTIDVEEGDVLDRYYWAYSTADLGLPTGDIEFGSPCPECGMPEVRVNRSFVTAFSRDRWQGEDFCTSSFFGPDFLYVSQRVYRLIDSLPDDLKGDVVFEPIVLL